MCWNIHTNFAQNLLLYVLGTLWVPSSGNLHIFLNSAFQMVSSMQHNHATARLSAHTTFSAI